jgi:hypothetical protein
LDIKFGIIYYMLVCIKYLKEIKVINISIESIPSKKYYTIIKLGSKILLIKIDICLAELVLVLNPDIYLFYIYTFEQL